MSPGHPSTHTSSVHRRRGGERGVSLVELSVVVTITGILATLATYSVRERIYEAHSVEAVAMLGSIKIGLLAKADELTGNNGAVLQIGGRVGGFGGPLGLPGVLGGVGNDDDNGNDNGGNHGQNGGGNSDDIDGDGNRGHGNNEGRCDPDNPGAKGGANCGGDGDGSSGDGSSGGGDDSGAGSSSGSGSSEGGSGSPGGSGTSGVDGDLALCGSAAPVPASLDSVKGAAYQSRPSDWQAENGDSGWSCLHVSMSAAQRFQYGYDLGTTAVPTGVAPAGADSTFAAWARGDLDGDGRPSWFVLSGASIGGRVVMAPALTIIDQGE